MQDIKAEILAPAGDLLTLKGAVNAGADAVYIGGPKFGARAYAVNFDLPEFEQALRYAHLHGRKVYLTVNTLFKERELEELPAYLKPFYELGLDAVIVQDLGAFATIRDHFPDLAIHASTQMTVTGPLEAKRLELAGANRIVTARELSLQEIREIHENANVEIESFVHGALCYCYSGQCLLSSMIGGRSGNRGRCAQPCRLPYDLMSGDRVMNEKEEKYILSPKDMCTLELLPEILEVGVFSLKIEGRMKKPEYAAGVVSIYRKYLDDYLEHGKEAYRVKKEDAKTLYEIFNRNGFHQSYYKEHNGRNMITLKESTFRQRDEALISSIKSHYLETEIKEKIHGMLRISKDLPISLTVWMDSFCVTENANPPQAAQKQPVTKEALEKRMRKTGNTPFEFDTLSVTLDEGLFVPVGELNELRRRALFALEEQILLESKREESKSKDSVESPFVLQHTDAKEAFVVAVWNEEQFLAALQMNEVHSIYVESMVVLHWDMQKLWTYCNETQKEIYIRMPHIFRNEAKRKLRDKMKKWAETPIKGFVVRSLETYDMLAENETDKDIVFDYSIYSFNRRTMEEYLSLLPAPEHLTFPLELTYQELKGLQMPGQELLVYGKIPVMISAGCVKKTMNSCNKKMETLVLKDRKHVRFPVCSVCDYCYNVIWNEKPVSLLDCREDVKSLQTGYLRLEFTTESPNEMKQIIKSFYEVYKEGAKESQLDAFTRGHFRRGVE